MKSQASVPRDVFPPTPPGPEGSNGNGLLRVQWVAGAWLRLSLPQNSRFLRRYAVENIRLQLTKIRQSWQAVQLTRTPESSNV